MYPHITPLGYLLEVNQSCFFISAFAQIRCISVPCWSHLLAGLRIVLGTKTKMRFFMRYFETHVRVGGQLVKTRVQAANAFDAKLLLQAQYGVANIVGFVQQVS